mmetsp:Transcript_30710/g.102227  ORF Transcript_30710/g.102227 Transcript_30710/m.102227 type:complete len:233 (-) Transcript_30710:388-1086(-)
MTDQGAGGVSHLTRKLSLMASSPARNQPRSGVNSLCLMKSCHPLSVCALVNLKDSRLVFWALDFQFRTEISYVIRGVSQSSGRSSCERVVSTKALTYLGCRSDDVIRVPAGKTNNRKLSPLTITGWLRMLCPTEYERKRWTTNSLLSPSEGAGRSTKCCMAIAANSTPPSEEMCLALLCKASRGKDGNNSLKSSAFFIATTASSSGQSSFVKSRIPARFSIRSKVWFFSDGH